MTSRLELGASGASAIVAGPESARVRIVGIHGASHCADVFRPLFDARSLAGMRKVAIDLPGRFGSRTRPRSAIDDADFVAEVLGELGSNPITLVVGHSYGGAVALELALSHPRKLDALALVSTGARLRVKQDILDAYELAAQGEVSAPRGPRFRTDVPAPIVDALEGAFARVPVSSSSDDWKSANRFDRLDALADLELPTLVLAGDDDPFTPMKYSEFLASGITGARLVRLESGSHLAIVERSRDVADAIERFVSSRFGDEDG